MPIFSPNFPTNVQPYVYSYNAIPITHELNRAWLNTF